MKRSDLQKTADGWHYERGGIEIWVTLFESSPADFSNEDAFRQDHRATVRVGWQGENTWRDSGRIVDLWGLTYMYLELGPAAHGWSICLRSNKTDTAVAQALPYILGYAIGLMQAEAAAVREVKADDQRAG